ncbi:MAG: hypothetical protein WDW36_004035 [Sanguina aurantia]
MDPEALNSMSTHKSNDTLVRLGGVEGLARRLHSNLAQGLDPHSLGASGVQAHRRLYGANTLPAAAATSFLALVWGNMQDPIIILLCVAALISTVLGAAIPEERMNKGWIEGAAIWVAVILVVAVGAGNDYQKDIQFRKLNASKDVFMVKVLRGGQQCLVSSADIVVGDVLLLDTGDKLVADGVVIEHQGLVIDEASLTGEAEPIKKNKEEDPWIRSGTQVSDGSGSILVMAVGEHSEWGKTMASISAAGGGQTPLQESLEVVAGAVGKIGFVVALLCFVVLLIQWMVKNKGFPIKEINNNGPVQFFLYGVTIIVVAVPEGLPLAVTISLAYSMKKMMLDNNFVRVLAACETMGGATAICSDKTGTLTENRMTVVAGWFAGRLFHDSVPGPTELNPTVLQEIKLNCAMNSKAFLIEEKGVVGFVGNRTECALLLMLRGWGMDYVSIRAQNKERLMRLLGFASARKMGGALFGFSSARKMASALVTLPAPETGTRLYNKGAAEWVLKDCVSSMDGGGNVIPFGDSEREELLAVVTDMASRGLRCLALAYTDYDGSQGRRAQQFLRPENFCDDGDALAHDLILLAIVGIKDPVRKEVPEAVATCQRAGITVRMVTGDNIHTATHIARECGILPPPKQSRRDDSCSSSLLLYDGTAAGRQRSDARDAAQDLEMGESSLGFLSMEGPEFRAMPEAEALRMLPRLRVLARSSPEDKLMLVKLLKKSGEVVAVTGDGTNDAPALKESDVGLAMGISGTEVAKEAADIVILDDNFSSIVKSVLWGRSVFSNIRKFLQFQLTVNLVALMIAFIGAIVGSSQPLNVLQLLWVNLIMDTMGALALATEYPHPDLLLEKPHGRTENLINKKMWKHIFVQGAYQFFWLCICLYALPKWFTRYHISSQAEFYAGHCLPAISAQFPPALVASAYPGANLTSDSLCGIMGHCGLPSGGGRPGQREMPAVGPRPGGSNGPGAGAVRGRIQRDVCKQQPGESGPRGGSGTQPTGIATKFRSSRVKPRTPPVPQFGAARGSMGAAFAENQETDMQAPLSVLFNVFIMCQVANEINSRRINDEYNVFSGLPTNNIFIGVIVITMGVQALIINFLGLFFKTIPLDWVEWLVSIAIGMGSWPLSFITRYISR